MGISMRRRGCGEYAVLSVMAMALVLTLCSPVANPEGYCVFYVDCNNVKSLRHLVGVLQPEDQTPPGEHVIERHFGMIELTDAGFVEFKRALSLCTKQYLVIKAGDIIVKKGPGDATHPGNGILYFNRDSEDELRLVLHAVCPSLPIHNQFDGLRCSETS
ncbi:hypothetical protein [Desulfobaculum senezii]